MKPPAAMTSQEAHAYLQSLHAHGSKPGLSRTAELLCRIGSPQNRLRFVHIAGTNGKGSTAAMLTSVLQAAGLCVGRYTSPALETIHERICIHDTPIPDDILCTLTARIAAEAEAMDDHPTEFEFVTALALQYFADGACDLVVLETGMGGAEDSTNVIGPPEAAVITPIGLDHTQFLGETLEEIAAAKAGILKSGSAAVFGLQPEAVRAVLYDRAQQLAIPVRECDRAQLHCIQSNADGQRFDYRSHCELFITLLGAHQLENASMVVETVELLRTRGWQISDDALRRGLAAARWPGRFELLSRAPLFVVDGGHNVPCAQALAAGLRQYFPGRRFVFLVGVMADKDYPALLQTILPLAERFVAVRPDNPRALSAEALAETLRTLGAQAEAVDAPEDGVFRALALAGTDGAVCSFGSLYMTGAVRRTAAQQLYAGSDDGAY